MDPILPAPKPPPRLGPRSEWKQVIPASEADRIAALAAGCLQPDPHAREGAAYPVETLYLDTPDLTCFRRDGAAGLPKFRIRRYGAGQPLCWLEEKMRRGVQVWKRRSAAPLAQLAMLPFRESDPGDLAWFSARIRMLQLQPVLLLTYGRRAWIGPAGERLTIDGGLAATPIHELRFDPERNGAARTVAADCIAELKFPGRPTPLVERLATALGAAFVPWSKYRHAVLACDLVPPERSPI